MEHGLYDINVLQNNLLRMLNPREIARRGNVVPPVTPIVRIPPNSSRGNWIAKQVLDIGVYGIVWPHMNAVEDAYNAVAAGSFSKREGHPLREVPFARGASIDN